MYPFLTHTWNPIRGECPHKCIYCYMLVYPQPALHFADKEMNTNLGSGNYIFVGSSTDMWADDVPSSWIEQVLAKCTSDNKYLFQSKNPARFIEFIDKMPVGVILGTTIETNRLYPDISKAPTTLHRMSIMTGLSELLPTMVSIEPIIDFDVDIMVRWIKQINPLFISIGADSKGHKLPEPTIDKINDFKEKAQLLTEIKVKNNLKRLS